MEKQVVKYDITDAAISEMESMYMGLTVAGLDDQDGFNAVHEARMVVKGKRVQVEKKRKELKSDALAWGKKVDSEAKRIFGMLEPIETHLKTEEEKVTKEKQRIKEENDRKEKERIQKRVHDLVNFNCVMSFFDVAALSDEEFEIKLKDAESDFKAEQERKAAEARKQKEETERLEAERKELEKQRKQQEAKEAAIKAEQDKIDADRREIEEAKRLEIAKKEAAEQAVKDAEEKAKRVEVERIEKEKAEKEAKERKEAARPDREKLIKWINRFEIPELVLENEKAQQILTEAVENINAILLGALESAQEL